MQFKTRSVAAIVRPPAILLVGALGLVILPGCKSDQLPRDSKTPVQLLAARAEGDRQLEALEERTTTQLLRRVKAEHDDWVASRSALPPSVDILIISGGGDWGAFAAGVLKGWESVQGPLAKPQFDMVTGVSTGALIAPFAFLGDPVSTDVVVHTYRNPRKDWVKPRRMLSFLRGGSAYADIPGLEKELETTLDMDRLRRIAQQGDTGRALLVNVTNIDNQEMRVWDVAEEARAAVESGKGDRVYEVLLASAALPGIFPPRKIDGVLYVDGGITGNILHGGPRTREEDEIFITRWLASYPGVPIPKVRYWIIFNNEIRWPPEVVPGSWSAVLSRSMTASTRAATLNSMRLLIAQARLARLRHNADIEVRIAAVPDGWVPPKPGVFKKETMNALADIGVAMGADPGSWITTLADESHGGAQPE